MKKTILVLCITIILQSIFISLYADGIEPTGNPREITTLDHLLWFCTNSSSWGDDFIQTADIDASATTGWYSGSGFIPIGESATPFEGSYNGLDHTIDGLFINRASDDDIGFFGYTDNATISNLGLINVNITGDDTVAGLVGDNRYTTIDSCYCTGIVNGDDYVAGFIADNRDSFVENSYNSCTVIADETVGGFIAYNRSYSDTCLVLNCYNNGNVNGTNWNVGGIAGLNGENSRIRNCYNSGNVTNQDPWITLYTGGIVGINYGIVTNCYNTGDITGDEKVGGIAGHDEDADINYCYSVGSVTGSTSTDIGGLVGGVAPASVIMNSFWDTELSENSVSAGGTGKITDEMKNVATFTNESSVGLDNAWDFMSNPFDDLANNDYWDIDGINNNGYPFLSWQYPQASLDTPQNIIINVSATDIQISWDAVTNATSYKIFSSNDVYSGFSEDTSGGFDGESWSTDIFNEKKFYYVKAFN